MIVYLIRADVNNYQSFLPAEEETKRSLLFWFDCQPVETTWKPPEVYVESPKFKRGNFFGVAAGGTIACDQQTGDDERFRELLELSGEMLPLPHEGELFYVLNVLECVNALDREKSEWHPAMKSKIGAPKRYVFHRSRIPETPLFKIPETSRGGIYCHEGGQDPAYEFKRRYEQLGLTGLRFETLWSDDD